MTVIVMFCSGCICGVLALDSDETPYSSRTYVPRKPTAGAKMYQAPSYTPSRARRTLGKPLETSSSRRWWNPFSRANRLEDAPRAEAPLLADATPYQQQKHISVPTIKADPRAIQERKPFISSNKDTPNAAFTPAEKSEWKNPLLKPRQGIKDTTE
ncbi:MAG TPA: hypothetical protein P5111_10290 [Kiritimatiellia bacterium]|nr:hypothetical protein [Kiritimatiellia bacterium]